MRVPNVFAVMSSGDRHVASAFRRKIFGSQKIIILSLPRRLEREIQRAGTGYLVRRAEATRQSTASLAANRSAQRGGTAMLGSARSMVYGRPLRLSKAAVGCELDERST